MLQNYRKKLSHWKPGDRSIALYLLCNVIYCLHFILHARRRKASAAQARRAEQQKVKAQAECKDAIQKLRRAQLQESRRRAKDNSVRDVKRQVNAERSLRLCSEETSRKLAAECDRLQRVEQDKIQAQAECKRAVQKMRRFAAKEESVQDLRRQVNAERSLRMCSDDKSRRLMTECDRLQQGRACLLEELQAQKVIAKTQEKEIMTAMDKASRLELERDQLSEKIKAMQVASLSAELKEKDRLTELDASIHQATSGHSVVGLSQMLGVSPSSMTQVERAAKEGTLCSDITGDASTPQKGQRSRFLERVVTELTPAIEKICEYPKFLDGQSDSRGVASMILGKIARKKSRTAKSRRKLKYGNRPLGVCDELDSLLKELAISWRSAFRNHDRPAAKRLLQMTVSSIPSRRGRVSDWLGPQYFNEEVEVVSGSPIRLLKDSDQAKFRNGYTHTTLVQGVVTKLGSNECEVEVRENWGLHVVIMDQAGLEKVIWGQELERCSKNPHNRDDPYAARNYHKWNHRELQGVKQGTVVAYPCGEEYIKSKVVRVVRAGNWQRVLYTVSRNRYVCI